MQFVPVTLFELGKSYRSEAASYQLLAASY
jgi:hypothetical protein